MKRKQIQIRFDSDLYQWIVEKAKQDRRPISAWIREQLYKQRMKDIKTTDY